MGTNGMGNLQGTSVPRRVEGGLARTALPRIASSPNHKRHLPSPLQRWPTVGTHRGTALSYRFSFQVLFIFPSWYRIYRTCGEEPALNATSLGKGYDTLPARESSVKGSTHPNSEFAHRGAARLIHLPAYNFLNSCGAKTFLRAGNRTFFFHSMASHIMF